MENQTAQAYKIALAGMLALAFAGDAEAQERFPRWYIGLAAGYDITQDADFSSPTTNGDISLDNGYNLSAQIGYMPAMRSSPGGWRVEAEILYKENTIDGARIVGIPTITQGEFTTTSYMLNALYDFNVNSALMPYLGAGIGIADVELPITSGVGNTSDNDNVFAWQLLAGLGYSPVTLPYTIMNLGYRFHVTEDTSFGTTGGSISMDAFYSHSFEAGMKFRF